MGSLEQHGLHLSLSTDCITAEAFASRIAQQIEAIEGIENDGYAIKADEGTLKVQDGVYAGGDAVEAKSIVAAVTAGRKAAVSMD